VEYMALATLLRFGTPALLLGLIILNVIQSMGIKGLGKDIARLSTDLKETKTRIVWRDTYRKDVARIDRIERKMNGAYAKPGSIQGG